MQLKYTFHWLQADQYVWEHDSFLVGLKPSAGHTILSQASFWDMADGRLDNNCIYMQYNVMINKNSVTIVTYFIFWIFIAVRRLNNILTSRNILMNFSEFDLQIIIIIITMVISEQNQYTDEQKYLRLFRNTL